MTKQKRTALNSSQNTTNPHTTRIIETNETPPYYPFCPLPAHFFERALYKKKKAEQLEAARNLTAAQANRTVLTVQTWDGRDVMSVSLD